MIHWCRRGLAVAALLALGACSGGGSGAAPTTLNDPTASAVEGLSEESFADRASPAVAWADGRLLVLGGRRTEPGPLVPLTGAALVDVDPGDIELLTWPFTVPVAGAGLAVVGDEVVVIARSCDEIVDADEALCAPNTYVGAVLDLTDRTWEPLGVPIEAAGAFDPWVEVLGVTGAGEVVVRLGDDGQQVWALQPAEGEWRRLPDLDLRIVDMCLAGDQVMATARRQAATIDLDHPDAQWTATPPLPVPALQGLGCAEGVVLARSGPGVAPVARFDLVGRTWRRLDPPPAEGVYTYDGIAGEEVMFYGSSGGVIYDASQDTWRWTRPPVAASHPLVWGNGRLVGWQDATASTPGRAVDAGPG